MSSVSNGLDVLLPVVSRWFRATFGEPTPPQHLGWPSIAAGRNTLLFAPTGSGKTLAAFLACLDHLWRHPQPKRSVRILYLSPLKALNQDISRNLEEPLRGIRDASDAEGANLAPLTVGVRSGDTPASERQRLVRKPPDILISTPESLHLMLTSRARETLRGVSHVIVDEIHALCPNKRGVFLALLLERLEALNPQGFVRIGLSATQRPLDEVARFLGGMHAVSAPDGQVRFEPRPVSVIDTGQAKGLDLEVVAPFKNGVGSGGGGPVWPRIEQHLYDLIKAHRSTIIFANNRRVVERLTSRLNALAAADHDGIEPADDLVKSHHGSLSLTERRSTEDALKNGELAAVVATASLEMGIDMGAVDLVCQVESPGSVARGLQRVGRAGHVVGRISKGRLLAKTAGDLMESAALCHEMERGAVESLRVPRNCLDVLAQQVVACVAMDRWNVSSLFDLVRRAYPYRDLPAEAFEGVLKMISGRFSVDALRDLRARVSWDRVHNTLAPLPGTARLAIVNGGTIPDTGQYPVYLGENGPRLGELDEEFVYERRVGETFVLGTATWRIESIDATRVLVGRAEGESSLLPFWRGENAPRSAELGKAVGALCGALVESLGNSSPRDRLMADYRLDAQGARTVRDHVARQLHVAGAVPTDQTILIEAFRDPVGETGLAVLTPFGGTLHLALKLVLQARLRERLGITVAGLHGDDGLLFRLPKTDAAPLDLLSGLTSDQAEALVRAELGESALFGLRFRQNAARALLMPRPDPSRRTPLWLQRLRARDLLQVVRTVPDFPIVVETYRECLHDDLDLPRLRSFLDAIASGAIQVVTRRGAAPSPFAAELIFRFEQHYLYEGDDPGRSGRKSPAPAVVDDHLDSLLSAEAASLWLDPAAVGRVEGRLRNAGRPPRTAEEMAEVLRRLGDLAASELAGPRAAFLLELEQNGRALRLVLPGTREPERWISAEDAGLYASAFPNPRPEHEPPPSPALETVVRRFLMTHALIGLNDLTARYPIGPGLATEMLERWADGGELVRLEAGNGTDVPRWADGRNLADVRRLSIALKRKESVAVAPEVFADFLARKHGVHPETRREGAEALARVLEHLQGFATSAEVWETEVLPARVRDYRPAWLDERLALGDLIWRADADPESRGDLKVAFFERGGPLGRDSTVVHSGTSTPSPSQDAGRVLAVLSARGASFVADLARASGLAPSQVRLALDELLRHGWVSNDRFDPLRPGARAVLDAVADFEPESPGLRRSTFGRPRASLRRTMTARPEGRWATVSAQELSSGTDEWLLAWAEVLLARTGVLTRETVGLDPWAPSWRDLAPRLARAELKGEVRRGYFVEGLSGVQYATAETVETLARGVGTVEANGETTPFLISTLDPANLYGSGAPFDIDLLQGGTARLPRSPANFLVLCGGRPVLIIEAHGKRLTGLASASESELRTAVSLVPRLARPSRRVLKVETYNGAATLESPAAKWLEDAGFVRDYPGMAYYATG